MKKHTDFSDKLQVLLVVLIYLVITRFTCLIKYFTGFPCPACGLTRAYKSLINLDIYSAFHYHPLFWFIPPVLIFIFLSKKPLFNNTKIEAIFYIIVFLIIFSVYIYRLIQFFPDTEPLDYNKNSILYNFYLHIKFLFS